MLRFPLAIKNHVKDIPFALIYLLGAKGETAKLVAASGFDDGEISHRLVEDWP
jgi:hypothetical protein